jgi:iron complex outermembrane receptor protein
VALLAGARLDAVTFGVTDRLPADGDASGSRTLSAPSGTVGLSVRVVPSLVGWARLGTGFETPTTTELANRPDGGGGFNPELEPQHAVEGELGLRLTAGAVRVGAAFFHAAVRDELVAFEVSRFRRIRAARISAMPAGLGTGAWSWTPASRPVTVRGWRPPIP